MNGNYVSFIYHTSAHTGIRESVRVSGGKSDFQSFSGSYFRRHLCVLHSIHFSGVERINDVRNKYNGDNTVGSDEFAKPTLIRNPYPYLYNERYTHRRRKRSLIKFTLSVCSFCIVVCIINNSVANLRAPTLRASV